MPSTSSFKSRIVSTAALVALFVPLLGCDRSTPPAEPLVELQDDLVFNGPLLIIPGSRWEPRPGGRIAFRNRSSLLFWVREPLKEPLVLRLQPHRSSAGQRFIFEWNDSQLPEERVEHSEAGVRVRLLPGDLPPGNHRLQIWRNHGREASAAIRQNSVTALRAIHYRLGESRSQIKFDRLERDQRIASFAQHGVTGKGKERRGGVLFVGPGQHEVELARAASSSLRLEPQNFSSAEATFHLRGPVEESITVAAGERAVLEARIGPGEHALRLEVEGEEDGVFLWGMPIAGDTRPDLTPIILVTLDTTRRDVLGPYLGHGVDGFAGIVSDELRRGLTPNLDQLASHATVYDRAFSTAPWTLPSHASIFTGLYPSKHGAGVSEVQLPGHFPVLARLLRERGYLTAGFSSGDLSSSRFGLAQGFHYYRDPDQFETKGDQLDSYLESFLEEYSSLPLFLFINYFDPHALYQAPPEYTARYGVDDRAAELSGPGWDELLDGRMAGWRMLVEGEVMPTPEGVDFLRAGYLAEVAWTDYLLGRLFDRLRKLEIYDRALIIITADHGELIGEGGYFSHAGRLDAELVEIPLIVKWPGQKETRREGRLASLVDLFPTVLRAAGIEPPPSDGKELFLDPSGASSEDGHSFVFFEEHRSVVHPLPKYVTIAEHLYGIQRPDFRQVVWEVAQDCERRGAAGWETVDCQAEVEEVLAAVRAELGERKAQDGGAALSDEVTESLKALGYI